MLSCICNKEKRSISICQLLEILSLPWSSLRGLEPNWEPERFGKSRLKIWSNKKTKFWYSWVKPWSWQLNKTYPLRSRWNSFWLGESFTGNAETGLQPRKGSRTVLQSARIQVPSKTSNQLLSWKATSSTNFARCVSASFSSSTILCSLRTSSSTILSTFQRWFRTGFERQYRSARKKVLVLTKLYNAACFSVNCTCCKVNTSRPKFSWKGLS